MAISTSKYSEKHLDIARENKRVLFKWEMDKRFVDDPANRSKVNVIGTMNEDRARRIWEIILETERE